MRTAIASDNIVKRTEEFAEMDIGFGWNSHGTQWSAAEEVRLFFPIILRTELLSYIWEFAWDRVRITLLFPSFFCFSSPGAVPCGTLKVLMHDDLIPPIATCPLAGRGVPIAPESSLRCRGSVHVAWRHDDIIPLSRGILNRELSAFFFPRNYYN